MKLELEGSCIHSANLIEHLLCGHNSNNMHDPYESLSKLIDARHCAEFLCLPYLAKLSKL